MRNKWLISLSFIIYQLSFSMTLASCAEWLDVGSKSEVDENEMFRTAEGYQATLTGLYLNLGSTKLYGGNLPLLALEPLTQQYLIGDDEPDRGQWSQFNYQTDEGQQMVSDIWLTMYNTIVNANMLLQQLDHASEAGVDAVTADNMRGEVLGLRALMYFDLVRLYNDHPTVDAACRNVPFKTDFGFQLGRQLPTDSLLLLLVDDLTTAQRLLTPCDGTLTLRQRQHFTRDACTALMARLQLYRGEYSEAEVLARELTDCQRYRYIRAEEILETDVYGAELRADRLFEPELIFALYTENILTTSRTWYEGLSHDFVKTADLFDDDDVRRVWLFSNPSALGKINLIRYQRSTRQQDQQRYGDPVVPMLKLSEMQLIVAECALQRGDADEARRQLNMLREARGEAALPATADATAIEAALTHEYQCDFRGEGQLFYYYKRCCFSTIDDGYGKGNTVSVPMAAYTLPLPPYEIQFGYGEKKDAR